MVRQSNYWFETCPTRRNVVAGIMKNVDVLIIGGGIAGMSLLFRLLNSKMKDVYLVEEASAAFHASGRSSGQLVMRGYKNFTDMQPGIAEEYIKFLGENNKRMLYGLRNVGFETDLCESAGLRLAVDDEEMEVLMGEADFISSQRDINVVPLDQQELGSLLPQSNFKGGIFVPNEATFNPYEVVNGLMDLVEKQGVRVLTGTQVDEVKENKDGSLSVSIRHRGTIRAKQVVYCTNAYTPELLPELAACMTPVRGQMAATDVLPDEVLSVLPNMSMMCNHGYEYFRLHGGRLLVGGMRHAVRGHQEGTVYDGETSQAVYDRLRGFVSDHLPFIKTNFTHTWSGIMCSTSDGLPLIGKVPGKENQYIMAGFNGYGFSHALMGSMILRDYLTLGRSDLPGANIFDPARLFV